MARTPDGSDCVHGSAPGPQGTPTVLLYCHYDVQPPLGEDAWRTPVWDLTEGDDGRWYGRGSADCKGNVVMHLTALRALKAVDGGLSERGVRAARSASPSGPFERRHFGPSAIARCRR